LVLQLSGGGCLTGSSPTIDKKHCRCLCAVFDAPLQGKVKIESTNPCSEIDLLLHGEK
jgi:hypothetical protein